MHASVFILSARSPVFRAMFKSGMEESKSLTLEMDDVSEAQLKLFLHVLHSDSLPDNVSIENGTALAALADRYDVSIAKALAVNCVCSQINAKTVSRALNIGAIYRVAEIVEHAVRFSSLSEENLRALADGLHSR